ncbi:uncharacterized protein LOC114327298 [Diabrotica virgifera virgifera]|uniref:Kazal-like domain-containing protein n=1 Tax=Diabrotica virgifera virgifera TaxID=50390 RepID=A0ABM5IFL6_DIAVI|nr:uncharacterized protein LOC114327298 [Diabrotica virgifera virgifera]
MKFVSLLCITIFTVLVIISAVFAAPSKESTEASTEFKGSTEASIESKGSTDSLKESLEKKSCLKDCGLDFTPKVLEPVCGGDGTGIGDKTFGNECVLSNFNCVHSTNLKVVNKWVCPGPDGWIITLNVKNNETNSV